MRIALFTDTYVPDVNGVARTLGRLVAHAVERGHRVALVTPRVGEREDAADLHRQLGSVPFPFYRELQLARFLDREGRRALAAFRPHLVHVATESTVGWSGRQWALRHGVPLVTSFHTDFPAYLPSYGLGWLVNPAWRFLRRFHEPARLTFCPSRATREQLRDQGFHERSRIWSRGVDTVLFTPSRRSWAVRERLAPGADRIVMYVGRLAWEKRLKVLAEAFLLMRETHPGDLRLVLVGDGPARTRLERDLAEGTHFTGYLRGDELADAYAAADVFVFPSDTETFGNVVAEAMASGLPVVAPSQGGVTETVRPGETGVLVPPRDSQAFAEATLTLLEDEPRRVALSVGARREALARRWSKVMDGLLEEYRSVCAVEPLRETV